MRGDDDGGEMQMWIMISGPYSSGAADEHQREANLRVMNEAALLLFRMGHVPVIGVNMALPVIEAGGAYDEVMMPLSLALGERCDACLRIGGASRGADDEAALFSAKGLPVYSCLDDVPSSSETN